MKVRTSVRKGIAFVAIGALTFAACDDKSAPVAVLPVEVTVVPSSATLTVGQTLPVGVTVANAANTAVTWSTSNAAVATVSTAGVITAVAPGSALITATSVQDPNAKNFVSVTVTQALLPVVTITPQTGAVQTGQTIQLVVSVTGTTNTAFTCTSAAPAVATVVQNATGCLVSGVTAGTAVITARSAANTAAAASSTITVSTTPVQVPVVVITPTTASVARGATLQFVVNVSNATNTAFTCASATPAVATVVQNAQGCLATGVAVGTAVISATSAANNTVVATATLTVTPPPTQPSISIQSVTGAGGVVIPVGATVSGIINVRVNVTAGDLTTISSVQCRLGGTVAHQQVFNPPLAPTQGVAQIDCPINTAQLNAAGQPVFANGPFVLTAVAIGETGSVVATATFGNLILNNTNQVAGVVTFVNTLDDVDNDPANASAVDAAGLTWFGGSMTVALTTAIFQGNAVATVSLTLDTECDGATAGNPTRTVTITNGVGSITWSEANNQGAATPGIDDLQDPSVCLVVSNARDAANAVVTLPATGGTGNVIVVGAPGPFGAVVGPAQQSFAIDNVEPVIAGPVTLNPAVFDLLTTDAFLGIGVAIIRTGASANVVGATATDAGVGGVTYRFIAVPTAAFMTATSNNATLTQATLAAAAAAGTAFTSADQLASTLEADAYTLVIQAIDALGNVTYHGNADNLQFGVDLARPTIAVVAADSPPANAINPTDVTIRLQVTDEFSGAEGVTGRTFGHSVFEFDADNGVEQRCYHIDGTFRNVTVANCTNVTISAPVLTVGATEFYDITIPADENHYVITVQSRDAAGNLSETTITREALVDVTAGPDAVNAPGVLAVTIGSFTINNDNNTASVNGTLRDNISIASYDARFEFVGLTSTTDVPDAVPFTAPVAVRSFGLPLTGELAVSATTSVNVDNIVDNPTDAAADFTVSNFGFGMQDVAGNFAFGGVAVPVGAFTAFTNFNTFTLEPSVTTIDRTPSGGSVLSTNLVAVATTPPGATAPVASVYFYYVHPGSDLVYGTADDHNVLIGVVPSSSATVLTGETVREFRFTQALAATSLPANVNGFQFRTFAIGVAADGDAVISDVDLITVNN